MDTIGDLLTRIRNASMVGKKRAVAPWSRMGEAVASLLVEHGYLAKVVVEEVLTKRGSKVKQLVLSLVYASSGASKVTGIRRVSKPGRREYVKSVRLPRVLAGYGIAVVSTSKGIMTAKEARKKRLGGEIVCLVW